MTFRPLAERVRDLERRVELLEARAPRPPAAASATPAAAPVATAGAPAPATPSRPAPIPAAAPRPAATVAPAVRATAPRFRLPHVNVPAALGVIISLLGFSFLLKLALDEGWLRLSIETRHVLVALTGAAFVAAGWRWRERRAAFARTLIGGGIATLCLTIYSAVLVFDVLGHTPGFAALVAVVVLAGVLAATLRSRVLAILGLVGGLSAPLLIPDALDGMTAILLYYAVFATATFALSFRHSWPTFNLLSFLGVFGCAAVSTIGVRLFGRPATSIELALVAVLFALGLGTAIASHLKSGSALLRAVDRVLVLFVPSATFGLLALNELGARTLAAWSIGLGVAYALAAWRLAGRTAGAAALVQPLVAVACGFVALAVPLALDGEWIVAAWAVGAAVQIRIATRQQSRGHAVAGVLLLGLTALYQLALLVGVAHGAPAFRHGVYIAGVWLALMAALAAWWLDRPGPGVAAWPVAAWVPFGTAALVWTTANVAEILRVVSGAERLAWLGLLAAGSAAAALGIATATGWGKTERINDAFAPAVGWMLLAALVVVAHPAEALGLAMWPALLGVLALVVRRQQTTGALVANVSLWFLHTVTLAVVAWEAHHRLRLLLDGVWPHALVIGGVAALTIVECRSRGDRPVYRNAILPTTVAALLFATGLLQLTTGYAPPLGFVPLLNPVDVATAGLVAALWLLGRTRREPSLGTFAALFALGCGSMTVLRAVHWYADVPFTANALAHSMIAHSALTVVWGVTGLAAMIGGAIRGHRTTWLGGAGLMAVVVAKLFTVDLGGVNTGARIVSFLGVGALLLAVGYFAPAPPRHGDAARRVGVGIPDEPQRR